MSDHDCFECGKELSFPPRQFTFRLPLIGSVHIILFDHEDKTEDGSCGWCAGNDDDLIRCAGESYEDGKADGYYEALRERGEPK